MVYSYSPAYYSTLHDSITSICRSLLPFHFRRRGLPSSEQRLQSDNLKWQQESFHQMLNLMGLEKEGILAEAEVSAFRSHLLETLVVSPPEQEHPSILKDKLVFLQELMYAKCISEEEYQASKRPLMRRLAEEGAEVEERDVTVAGQRGTMANSEEEWSIIDLKDERWLLEKENPTSKNRSKPRSAVKQMNAASSVFSFVSYKPRKSKAEKSVFNNFQSPPAKMAAEPSQFTDPTQLRSSRENPFWDVALKEKEKENESSSALISERSKPKCSKGTSAGAGAEDLDKFRRKPFSTLFQKDHGGGGGHDESDRTGKDGKSAKKNWGFDRLRKWKRSNSEDDDDTAPLPLHERSDSEFQMEADMKLRKGKLSSSPTPSEFFSGKVRTRNSRFSGYKTNRRL